MSKIKNFFMTSTGELFKKYFDLPFRNDYNVYIKSANNRPVATFLRDFDTESCNHIVEAINGNYKAKTKNVFTISNNEENVIIMNGRPFLLIRGWGYLTGIGGCKLSSYEAKMIQRSLTLYICDQLNKACENNE